MDAIEMSFSVSSWLSSSLFPLSPLMLMCRKLVQVIEGEKTGGQVC